MSKRLKKMKALADGFDKAVKLDDVQEQSRGRSIFRVLGFGFLMLQLLLGFLCLPTTFVHRPRLQGAISKNVADLNAANGKLSELYSSGVVKGFSKSCLVPKPCILNCACMCSIWTFIPISCVLHMI